MLLNVIKKYIWISLKWLILNVIKMHEVWITFKILFWIPFKNNVLNWIKNSYMNIIKFIWLWMSLQWFWIEISFKHLFENVINTSNLKCNELISMKISKEMIDLKFYSKKEFET